MPFTFGSMASDSQFSQSLPPTWIQHPMIPSQPQFQTHLDPYGVTQPYMSTSVIPTTTFLPQLPTFELSGMIPTITESADSPNSSDWEDSLREEGRENYQYACLIPTCGETFPTKFSLKRHMKRHTGEKPFICNWTENGAVCSRRFAEKSTLKRHVRTHTGEKPYQCSHPGCSKTFADRANCHRHEITHRNRC